MSKKFFYCFDILLLINGTSKAQLHEDLRIPPSFSGVNLTLNKSLSGGIIYSVTPKNISGILEISLI